MNPAAGLVGAIIMLAIVASIIVGGIVYSVTRLTRQKEIVSTSPLVPIKRLITDGKQIDTVYVYPIK